MSTELKGKGGLGRATAILVSLLLCLPTVWLVMNFVGDFVYGTEVVYSHGFWMAVCGVASGWAMLGLSIKTKPKDEQNVVVLETRVNVQERQANELKASAKESVVKALFKAALILLVICLLALFDAPKIVFWLGLIVLCIFSVVGFVKAGRKNGFGGTAGWALVIGLYGNLFWMVYAYAYGWLAFTIWALVRIAGQGALMWLMCQVVDTLHGDE